MVAALRGDPIRDSVEEISGWDCRGPQGVIGEWDNLPPPREGGVKGFEGGSVLCEFPLRRCVRPTARLLGCQSGGPGICLERGANHYVQKHEPSPHGNDDITSAVVPLLHQSER